MLADSGAAIELIPASLAARPATAANRTYSSPVFNEQVFANKLIELLTNPIYKQQMGVLQTAAAASGGVQAAANAIEEAYLRADDQADLPAITDLDYRDKMRTTSACKYYCGLILLLALIGYCLWAIIVAYCPEGMDQRDCPAYQKTYLTGWYEAGGTVDGEKATNPVITTYDVTAFAALE